MVSMNFNLFKTKLARQMFYDRFIFKVFREVKKTNKKKINAHLKTVYS